MTPYDPQLEFTATNNDFEYTIFKDNDDNIILTGISKAHDIYSALDLNNTGINIVILNEIMDIIKAQLLYRIANDEQRKIVP